LSPRRLIQRMSLATTEWPVPPLHCRTNEGGRSFRVIAPCVRKNIEACLKLFLARVRSLLALSPEQPRHIITHLVFTRAG
jgi:hypothetical protein